MSLTSGRYSEEARQALLASREEALQLRHRVIGPEHLLLGMLKMNHPIIECTKAADQFSTFAGSAGICGWAGQQSYYQPANIWAAGT
jgi:hypothetical protein